MWERIKEKYRSNESKHAIPVGASFEWGPKRASGLCCHSVRVSHRLFLDAWHSLINPTKTALQWNH